MTSDSLKPFVVKTAEANVKVLGTSFNVMNYTDEAKVEVVFAIDKNGTLTDLKVTHCEERHFADRLCKTIALSPKWSPGRTKGKPVKTELEMRFVFRLVAPPAGQEELGLCAEECDIHTTADRMPLFCGAVRTGFVRGCSGRSTA